MRSQSLRLAAFLASLAKRVEGSHARRLVHLGAELGFGFGVGIARHLGADVDLSAVLERPVLHLAESVRDGTVIGGPQGSGRGGHLLLDLGEVELRGDPFVLLPLVLQVLLGVLQLVEGAFVGGLAGTGDALRGCEVVLQLPELRGLGSAEGGVLAELVGIGLALRLQFVAGSGDLGEEGVGIGDLALEIADFAAGLVVGDFGVADSGRATFEGLAGLGDRELRFGLEVELAHGFRGFVDLCHARSPEPPEDLRVVDGDAEHEDTQHDQCGEHLSCVSLGIDLCNCFVKQLHRQHLQMPPMAIEVRVAHGGAAE